MRQILPSLHVVVLQHSIADIHLSFCTLISFLYLQVLLTLTCNGGRERKEVSVGNVQIDEHSNTHRAETTEQWNAPGLQRM